jgi:hypothetical protein
MGKSMNVNSAAGEDKFRRIVDEIAFQASILALHAAIHSASKAGGEIDEGARDQVHRLVEQARRPEVNPDSFGRPGVRGL